MSLGTILTHCEHYARCATPLYVGECRPDCLKRESAKILGHKERRCGIRLIDADELKKKLWCPTETYVTEDIVTEEEIDETPTAYDIDEKVSKLEELIEENVGHLRATPEANAYIKAIRDAIEIVKGGAK